MPRGRDRHRLVAALVLGALVVAGPAWAAPMELGDGTADVEIVAPTWLEPGTGPAGEPLHATPGRFGTEATYLRIPDLVVDARNVTGRPEVLYDLEVPEIGVDPRPVRRRLSSPGRYRLHLADVALPPAGYSSGDVAVPAAGTYTGRVTVRVQSFSGHRVVANRTVEVVVDR